MPLSTAQLAVLALAFLGAARCQSDTSAQPDLSYTGPVDFTYDTVIPDPLLVPTRQWAYDACVSTANNVWQAANAPYGGGGTAALINNCIRCVNTADNNNLWACHSCISTPDQAGAPTATMTIAQQDAVLFDTYSCFNCVSESRNAYVQRSGLWACSAVCKALSWNTDNDPALTSNTIDPTLVISATAPQAVACNTCFSTPGINTWGCQNCMQLAATATAVRKLTYDAAVTDAQISGLSSNCLACVQGGSDAYGCGLPLQAYMSSLSNRKLRA